MIDKSDLKLSNYFTTDGKDIWAVELYCLEPTVTLKNLKTGAIESFGLNGLTAEKYHKIDMPKIGDPTEDAESSILSPDEK